MKKILIFLLITGLAGLGFAWFAVRDSEKLEAVHPKRGPAVQAVYATGTVEPTVMIPIAPRQTAQLVTLLADEGQRVKKGDVLAQLEDADLRQTLVELQAKANLADKEFNRKSDLYQRKAASGQDFDQAKAARDSAHAAVDRAQAELAYLKLLAPEDGIIIRREGEAGAMIAINQPVFWMSCCKPLRIASEVDEEDISLVTPGQAVLINADAFPGKIYNGKVLSITPKGDPVARSYRVRISLEGETPLMIGMTAETNIITRKTDNALLVPAGAVANNKVWTVQNGKAHEVVVQTGAKASRATEITAGLDEKATVISDTGKSLTEGQDVSTILKDWQAR